MGSFGNVVDGNIGDIDINPINQNREKIARRVMKNLCVVQELAKLWIKREKTDLEFPNNFEDNGGWEEWCSRLDYTYNSIWNCISIFEECIERIQNCEVWSDDDDKNAVQHIEKWRFE